MRHPFATIAFALLLTMPVVTPLVAVACAPDMTHHVSEQQHCPPMPQHDLDCCFFTADAPLIPVLLVDVRVQPTVVTFSDVVPVLAVRRLNAERTPEAPPPRPEPRFLLDRVMLL